MPAVAPDPGPRMGWRGDSAAFMRWLLIASAIWLGVALVRGITFALTHAVGTGGGSTLLP